MRYVQHKSGTGTKFPLTEDCYRADYWNVTLNACSEWFHARSEWFPKSEYVLCEPPGRWVDVTAEVRERHSYGLKNDPGLQAGDFITHEVTDLAKLICGGRYRLRKMRLFDHGQKPDGTGFQPCEQWAFIVEKKED